MATRGSVASVKKAAVVEEKGPFEDFLCLVRQGPSVIVHSRVFEVLQQCLAHFPLPETFPTSGLGETIPLSQQNGTHSPHSASGAHEPHPPSGRRERLPSSPPLTGQLSESEAVASTHPFPGRCAIEAIPVAVNVCLDRIAAGMEEFALPLVHILRKAEEPLGLRDLRDERMQHEAVISLLDSVSSALSCHIRDVGHRAAVALYKIIVDIRLKGYDDMNPPPAQLPFKRDCRFRCLSACQAVNKLCAALEVGAPHGKMLFCLRALREASCYQAVACKMWKECDIFGLATQLIDESLEAQDGLQDERLPVAIELIWNVLDLDCSSRATCVATDGFMRVMHRLVERFLSEGYRLRDKQLRNDVLSLLTLVAGDQSSHPLFLFSGLLEVLWLIGCGAELQLPDDPQYKDRIKPFVLTMSEEDFEMKKLLWHLLYLLSFTPSNMDFLLNHDVLKVLLAYVNPDCEIPSVIQWPTLQLIDLQLQGLNFMCQLAICGEEEFSREGGSRILITFLQECLDVQLRNTTLRVLVHIATTKNRVDLAESRCIEAMLQLIQSVEEIEVRRDALQVLADTVGGDVALQREFAQAGGIAALMPFLDLSLEGCTRELEHLVFSAIHCVWACVLGCPGNEEAFLEADGVHALLDILSSCPGWIRIPLLTTLDDLLLSNKAATRELLEWQGPSGITAPQLLIRLWDSGGKHTGILPSEDTEKPFDSPFAEDIIRNELGEAKDTPPSHGGTARNRIPHTTLGDVTAHVHTQVGSNTARVPVAADMVIPGEDLKAKIYCILHQTGLTPDSPELRSLSDIDKMSLHVIMHYAALKRDQVWAAIGKALEDDGIKPIGQDRMKLEAARRHAKQRWEAIRSKQLSLQQSYTGRVDGEEKTFLRLVMKKTEEKRVAMQTGLSITEAKIRKAQMLKASFKTALGPPAAEASAAPPPLEKPRTAPVAAPDPVREKQISPRRSSSAVVLKPPEAAGKGRTEGERMLTDLEFEVYSLLCDVRRDPSIIIPVIERRLEWITADGTIIFPDGSQQVTAEGRPAYSQALSFLTAPRVLQPFADASPGMVYAARDHCIDQAKVDLVTSEGTDGSTSLTRKSRYGMVVGGHGESIALGANTAEDIVVQLIVNDGVESRTDRQNLFNPDFRYVGVACGKHALHHDLCVIEYASSYQNKTSEDQRDIHARIQKARKPKGTSL